MDGPHGNTDRTRNRYTNIYSASFVSSHFRKCGRTQAGKNERKREKERPEGFSLRGLRFRALDLRNEARRARSRKKGADSLPFGLCIFMGVKVLPRVVRSLSLSLARTRLHFSPWKNQSNNEKRVSLFPETGCELEFLEQN